MITSLGPGAKLCIAAKELLLVVREIGAERKIAEWRLNQCLPALEEVLHAASDAQLVALWEALAVFARAKRELEESR